MEIVPVHPLNSFTRFCELPTEIRMMIWGLACRKGRIITVRSLFQAPRMAIPIIAHINQESRSYALEIYALGFRHTRSTCGMMWWNPSVDIIYLIDSWRGLESCEDVLGPSVSKIRQMALDIDSVTLSQESPYFDIKSLRNFESLETLYLVLDPTFIAWRPGMVVFNRAIIGPVCHIDISPARLENFIMQQLENSMKALGKQWKLPTIKIVFVEVKRLRESRWCLPLH
jgi:hypothetical protein